MKLDLDLLDLRNGDCKNELRSVPTDSVDVVFTSPPYAEQRKKSYKSIPSNDYVGWFLPIAYEIKRILKPTGSFFLNLKSHCSDGERELYVYELIIQLRNLVGLRFIDEYVWYKSANPRKRSYRLKDAWEPIWHFGSNKEQNPFISHKVKIPSKSTFAEKRGWVSLHSVTGNMGGYHDIAKQVPGMTDPDNIVYFPTALLVKDKFEHPAKFPLELVEFFVEMFCPDNGVVCDPFIGSGITAVAAMKKKHRCIGIELKKSYCDVTMDRVKSYVIPSAYKPPDPRFPDLFPLAKTQES